MPDEELGPQEKIGLTKEQKTGFVLLLVFAVLAIGLGVLQIRNALYRPFALNNSVPPIVKDEVVTTDALRYRDTDFDGISDFDELYIYGTSPYLADTDSDGIPDKQEILAGKNPNCAEGKNCTTVSTNVAGEERPNATSSLGFQEPTAPVDLTNAMGDPAELRKFFLQNGIKKEQLDKISDAELIAGVQAAMAGADVGSLVSSIPTTTQ